MLAIATLTSYAHPGAVQSNSKAFDLGKCNDALLQFHRNNEVKPC